MGCSSAEFGVRPHDIFLDQVEEAYVCTCIEVAKTVSVVNQV